MLNKLKGPIKIKICGLTRPEDIDAVNAAGTDYAGFIFAKRSRRYVNLKTAKKLASRLDKGIVPVGVFSDASAEEVFHFASNGVFKIVQLHGKESADDIKCIRERLAPLGMQIIKAVTVDDLPAAMAQPQDALPDYFLIDSGSGGTGKTFDWERLSGMHENGNLINAGVPFFLAGGIGEKNISAALAIMPFAIDISSGAETGGLKDAGKIARLASAVHKNNHVKGEK